MTPDSPENVGQALRRLGQRIGRLDARLLIEHVCQLTHRDLIARSEQLLLPEQLSALESLAQRRESGEPLAYLVGSAEFRGLSLQVSPAVLVPRPETELLVELALQFVQTHLQKNAGDAGAGLRLLDLGTGSGAIALALQAALPQAEVWAVDQSPEALAVAQENAARLQLPVRFVQSDWFGNLPAGLTVDCIVSNPPYVAAGDPHLQGDGLRFEPLLALTDEADGLRHYRHFAQRVAQYLKPGGVFLVEHGFDQGAALRDLLRSLLPEVATWRDLAGIERVTGGVFPLPAAAQ